MKGETATALIEAWLKGGAALASSQETRLRSLLRAISIAGRGRVVSLRGQIDDHQSELLALGDKWASDEIRTTLDSYARARAKNSFADLLAPEAERRGDALIGHLEQALDFARSAQRQKSHFPRDTLLTEVLQQQSLALTLELAFARASSPLAIDLLIDGAYGDRLLKQIGGAKASIWVAVSNVTIPPNAAHPTKPLFDLLERRSSGTELVFIVPTDTDFQDGTGNGGGDKLARFALKLGARLCVLHPSVAFHAKIVIVDDEFVITGSHGWTGESLRGQGDLSVEIQDRRLAMDVQQRLISLCCTSNGRSVI